MYSYLAERPVRPPKHRMWAIEYHCDVCKPTHIGRFFKQPGEEDLARFEQAATLLERTPLLPIPDDKIPDGDETNRLHKWGYQYYRQMFNERQLLGLGLLLRRICRVEEAEVCHALLTVFSDFLRYQNMLCRYDTYALKCQDIFSVHGFPVGLIQCENNILGIPNVGSGSFRHFVEKYQRAKRYCEKPFETRYHGRRKEVLFVPGERIQANFVNNFPTISERQAYLLAASATEVALPPLSLDGIFTDPPYFDNVQYAELMDFCFSWLRLGLQHEFQEFRPTTTRTLAELTGNITFGKGIAHFTKGISIVFRHYAAALKPGAPFVFTYHHNDPIAYVPRAVAILDAGMSCTTTLPTIAEMSASLHIAGTSSSVLDSVFVCRVGMPHQLNEDVNASLQADITAMESAGMRVTEGDVRCLGAGHIARIVVNRLRTNWDVNVLLEDRITRVKEDIIELSNQLRINDILDKHRRRVAGENEPEEETFATTI